MFCKTRLECIRNLAEEMHSNWDEDTTKGLTPLHYVIDNIFGFTDKSYAMELFKNIFDAMEDKNPKDEFGNTPLHRGALLPVSFPVDLLLIPVGNLRSMGHLAP